MAQPHPQTETWLRSFGIENFNLRDIPVDRWEKHASLRNQARLTQHPVNDELVGEYAMAMAAGANFPPIIVTETPVGYISIDGNHRLSAAEIADKPTIAAYVLPTLTQSQKLLLTFDANTRHGLRTTPAERVMQAVSLHSAGVGVTEAARLLNVPVSSVGAIIESRETEAQLASAGIDTSRIGRSTMARLGAISNHNVRQAFATMVTTQSVPVTEVSPMVTHIRTLPTEQAAMAYVNAETQRRSALNATTGNGRIEVPAPIPQLQRLLTQLDNMVLPERNELQSRLPNELRTVLSSRTLDGISKLRRIASLLAE